MDDIKQHIDLASRLLWHCLIKLAKNFVRKFVRNTMQASAKPFYNTYNVVNVKGVLKKSFHHMVVSRFGLFRCVCMCVFVWCVCVCVGGGGVGGRQLGGSVNPLREICNENLFSEKLNEVLKSWKKWYLLMLM